MKANFRILLLTMIVVLTAIFSAKGQQSLNNLLPQDTSVITGVLDNGLKYYIRYNAKPEKRVEFRLAVNAGSILEDDDQQGLAHFIEHMAFNGTEDFDKNDLVNFLEKSGVDFGADLNAYTSFDETVYMFQMPSDRKGLIDSAFMVLENWAHKLSLDPEEIDKERGVVHEEWRLGLGAQDRMMKKVFPVIFKGSQYAVRLPIGKMNVIDSSSYDVIERFYNDWYRPNLMALVVVGDMDPEIVEMKIKEHFSGIKNPTDERERIDYSIPENEEPLIAIAKDEEAFYNQVMLLYKQDKLTLTTEDDYRRKLMIDLYVKMLNARIDELSRKPDAPFAFAQSMYMGFLSRSIDAFGAMAMAKENQILESIDILITENERVRNTGFNQSELERQKAEILSNMAKAVEEKDKTDSRIYVNEYIDNFLEHEAFPGIDYEYQLTQQLLPTISKAELNNLSQQLVSDKNLVIMILAPDKEGVLVPDEEEVLATIAEAKSVELEAYQDDVFDTELINKTLPGAEIIETVNFEEFGITKLKLSNGVQVILKPTDFKNDEILMTSFGLGGTSVVPDDQFISANYANDIINESGIGSFSNTALKKFLTGKNVSVTPYISDLTQGVKGNVVNKDLETLFQLAYLYFTEPRKDPEAFEAFKSQMINQFKFMKAYPKAVFYDTIAKLASGNDPRTIAIPTEEQINSIDLEVAYNFYQKTFKNANGHTFVFVGNFELENIKPLITNYLGSLPSINELNTWKDVSPEFPEGITKATVYKGSEPQSSVMIMMDEAFEWSDKNLIEMNALMKILNIRMRESMREEQGGVYGVRAYPNISKYPKEEVNISISWGCAPENVDQLVETVFNEMDSLKIKGPNKVNLLKAKETMIRDYETNFQKNEYWLNKIKNSHYYNVKLKSQEHLHEMIESIRSEDLQEMAQKYFSEEHYLKVVLMPENEMEE
jgi:zinc protease